MNKKDKLDIIYEDKEIIVINKPCNLLTIATQKEKEKTLFHKVLLYERKKNKNNKVFIVHRLDKDTSGLIIFAKNERIKHLLQDKWNDIITYRGYYAIVHGNINKEKDILKNYLEENAIHNVYVTNKNNGKLAITKYNKIKSNNLYSLLDIEIKTGRKNQIRVQLSNINYPILGDKKYGKKDMFKRLYLHAYKLEFIHPINHRKYLFETKMPKEFNIIN